MKEYLNQQKLLKAAISVNIVPLILANETAVGSVICKNHSDTCYKKRTLEKICDSVFFIKSCKYVGWNETGLHTDVAVSAL